MRAVAIVLVVLAAYIPAYNGEFVWDDTDIFIVNNPMLRDVSGLADIWFSTKPVDYYPLTYTSFWMEWRLWGTNPCGYRIVNILLHAASAVLLWRVLLRLRIPAAWLIAVAFGLHPVNVESVAWISERKNTLSMCFYLASALSYIRTIAPGSENESGFPKRGFYLLSLLCFAGALLAKSGAVVLPVALVGIGWWQRRRLRVRDVMWTLPFFVMAVSFGAFTVWYHCLRKEFLPASTDSLVARTAAAGWYVSFYLQKALLPMRLSFVYPLWSFNPALVWSWVPNMLLASSLLVAFAFQRKSAWRATLAGLGYFVVALIPVLGLVGVAFMRFASVADHVQYYAIPGVIALVVGGGQSFLGTVGIPRPLRRALGVALVSVLFALCWQRAGLYRTQKNLYRDAIAKNPTAWLAHVNLGNILNREGDLHGALRHYDAAVRADPDSGEAFYNRGRTRLKLGVELPQAIDDFSEVLARNPGNMEALFNRGLTRFREGSDTEGALRDFNRALMVRPAHTDARYYRGCLLVSLNDWTTAARDFGLALSAATENWSHREGARQKLLGATMAQKELRRKAGDKSRNAGTAVDGAVAMLKARGAARVTEGNDLDDAVADLSAAIRLKPWDADLHYLRALARIRMDTDPIAALGDLNIALELDPDHINARRFRARMRLDLQDVPGAVADLCKALGKAPADWPYRAEAVKIIANARASGLVKD